MAEGDLLRLAVRVSRDLEAEGIPHALTGSLAASVHGEPETSIDVDFVARMDADAAVRLARRWNAMFADEDSFQRAAVEYGMANAIEFPSGIKVDISVLPPTPFYEGVLRRCLKITPAGTSEGVWVVTAEDIVLMKLVWRKDSRSAKQWYNALSVVRVRGHSLDWAYIRRWAAELAIESDLDALRQEAGI